MFTFSSLIEVILGIIHSFSHSLLLLSLPYSFNELWWMGTEASNSVCLCHRKKNYKNKKGHVNPLVICIFKYLNTFEFSGICECFLIIWKISLPGTHAVVQQVFSLKAIVNLTLKQNTVSYNRHNWSSWKQFFRCKGNYGDPSEIFSICSLGVFQVGSLMLQLWLLWYS